ncbi:hypothetical protein [Rhodococcus chondri]|uniref:Uncharacterized protein n=1 Tax=Rhodococcus chondri TaxID=3065941 RepID=A0ABU7JP11_9NOCA|nr:hypothetical protein [Rhodococcus sp. CC-R104]MEE2031774.1 hypothetical protein [Rhodococcus sp. CC-R104]
MFTVEIVDIRTGVTHSDTDPRGHDLRQPVEDLARGDGARHVMAG